MKKRIFALALSLALFAGTLPALAEEIPAPVPGERTVFNLLATALAPVGGTLYVWGGGWNEADDGAGVEAVSIGISEEWREFYDSHGSDYNFDEYRYRIHSGLDCSGYVGWAVYNTFNTQSGGEGYVMPSTLMASNFAGRGWGTYTPRGEVKELRAGDIMSTNGHVYIGVGQCSDGSRVLLHASPPAVQLTGTANASGSMDSEGVRLANEYSARYWPEFHAKFPDHSRDYSYVTNFDQMSWDASVLSDPQGLRFMDAAGVLRVLFGETAPALDWEELPFTLTVNGTAMADGCRYPAMFYRDIVYCPLTAADRGFLGLSLEGTDGNFVLSRSQSTGVYAPEPGPAADTVGVPVAGLSFNGAPLTDGAYPAAIRDGVVYLPLTWNAVAALGWSMTFGPEGLSIVTG